MFPCKGSYHSFSNRKVVLWWEKGSRASKFVCFGGTRAVPWADSSGGKKEKGIVCGRAELLFYFCVLHFVAVSELQEQIFFKVKQTNLKVLEHLGWGADGWSSVGAFSCIFPVISCLIACPELLLLLIYLHM